MKILCLHGMGQNGDIFEALTGPLRSKLPSDWEFEFIDGSAPCSPAPGVGEIFAGPFFCHGQTYDTDCIKNQHEYIQTVIEDEGPFDGVLGFSQGAAIAASIILHQQLERTFEPPVFRFAIFCAGTLPFTKDPGIGILVTQYYGQCKVDTTLESLRANSDNWDVFDESLGRDRVCNQFIPWEVAERLEIPTVHIYDGHEKSAYLNQQHPALADLCRADCRFVFHHNAGHKMPSGMSENLEIARMIKKAAELSQVQL